jgi:predicted nucleotidyltransferase
MDESAHLRRKALNVFVDKLKQQEGDNLLQVILFGSVARGDDHKDSDVDVFVLVKTYDIAVKDRILDLASDIGDIYNHEVYISPFICSEKVYLENKKRSLVYYEIADEGVVFYEKGA